MMQRDGAFKQEINLFLPELRPARDLVTAARLLSVIAVLTVLMAGLSAIQWWQRDALSSEQGLLQSQLREQSSRTEQIERQVAERATDQALVAEMDNREQSLAQAQQLYEFLSNSTLGNLTGFSGHLKDLSRASFSDIWLSELVIRGDAEYIRLSGYTPHPALLPSYVSGLSVGQSSIRNRNFARLSTSQAIGNSGQGELYQFVLETD